MRIDVQKIQQVFLNVLMNALDAMRAHGGTLTIRGGFSERDGFCRVAFTDTGVGIPEEHLPRVFEPFFTTKEVGEGVGCLLYTSPS
ncbi:MAG: ATP-binding protein, partial [Candidatus Eisenbacteria bacterium]|nr:ATP-binding protein [Candidatus Eisenbacteria bacterium]